MKLVTRTLDVPCPTCGVEKMLQCVTRSGEVTDRAHPTRVKAGRALPPHVVDFLAYGNFTDPDSGVNGIIVRFTDDSSSPWRTIIREVRKLVRPWLDEGEKKLYLNVDGDPDPETKTLWNRGKNFRRYKWCNGVLVEVKAT